jgi:hypothetical protein
MQSIRNGLWFLVGIIASICVAEKFHEHTKLPSTSQPTVQVKECGANQSVRLSKLISDDGRSLPRSEMGFSRLGETIKLMSIHDSIRTEIVSFDHLGMTLLVPKATIPFAGNEIRTESFVKSE